MSFPCHFYIVFLSRLSNSCAQLLSAPASGSEQRSLTGRSVVEASEGAVGLLSDKSDRGTEKIAYWCVREQVRVQRADRSPDWPPLVARR